MQFLISKKKEKKRKREREKKERKTERKRKKEWNKNIFRTVNIMPFSVHKTLEYIYNRISNPTPMNYKQENNLKQNQNQKLSKQSRI